jgi:poly(3-hydroxyalkanoate) synthetase
MAAAKEPKQYKITFHGEGGDVEIAHNFKLNVYKRNVETTIDENYLAVLKHAVVHTVVDGKEVTIPQYNYTVEAL